MTQHSLTRSYYSSSFTQPSIQAQPPSMTHVLSDSLSRPLITQNHVQNKMIHAYEPMNQRPLSSHNNITLTTTANNSGINNISNNIGNNNNSNNSVNSQSFNPLTLSQLSLSTKLQPMGVKDSMISPNSITNQSPMLQVTSSSAPSTNPASTLSSMTQPQAQRGPHSLNNSLRQDMVLHTASMLKMNENPIGSGSYPHNYHSLTHSLTNDVLINSFPFTNLPTDHHHSSKSSNGSHSSNGSGDLDGSHEMMSESLNSNEYVLNNLMAKEMSMSLQSAKNDQFATHSFIHSLNTNNGSSSSNDPSINHLRRIDTSLAASPSSSSLSPIDSLTHSLSPSSSMSHSTPTHPCAEPFVPRPRIRDTFTVSRYMDTLGPSPHESHSQSPIGLRDSFTHSLIRSSQSPSSLLNQPPNQSLVQQLQQNSPTHSLVNSLTPSSPESASSSNHSYSPSSTFIQPPDTFNPLITHSMNRSLFPQGNTGATLSSSSPSSCSMIPTPPPTSSSSGISPSLIQQPFLQQSLPQASLTQPSRPRPLTFPRPVTNGKELEPVIRPYSANYDSQMITNRMTEGY